MDSSRLPPQVPAASTSSAAPGAPPAATPATLPHAHPAQPPTHHTPQLGGAVAPAAQSMQSLPKVIAPKVGGWSAASLVAGMTGIAGMGALSPGARMAGLAYSSGGAGASSSAATARAGATVGAAGGAATTAVGVIGGASGMAAGATGVVALGAAAGGASSAGAGDSGSAPKRGMDFSLMADRLAVLDASGLYDEEGNIRGDPLVDESGMTNIERKRLALKRRRRAERRKRYLRGGSSVYRGVTQTSANTWQAQITHKRKNQYIGMFRTAHEAARAYDGKAKELLGDTANTNFSSEDEGEIPRGFPAELFQFNTYKVTRVWCGCVCVDGELG